MEKKKYIAQDFLNALSDKGVPNLPPCRFCQGKKFTTTEQLATILLSTNKGEIDFGPNVPSGMIVCEKCGHIEFFALGPLGLLEKEESRDAE